jgi:hypothetical protein
MAEQNPELQTKLQELEHELEVGLFSKLVPTRIVGNLVSHYPRYDVAPSSLKLLISYRWPEFQY